jgi:hypothetical protein
VTGRRAAPPIPDAPGCDLKPDPAACRTFADLAAALRDFRLWAGEPSYRRMAAGCGQLVSASGLHQALNGDRPLRASSVRAAIRGCGGTEADEERFMVVWRRISIAVSGRIGG